MKCFKLILLFILFILTGCVPNSPERSDSLNVTKSIEPNVFKIKVSFGLKSSVGTAFTISYNNSVYLITNRHICGEAKEVALHRNGDRFTTRPIFISKTTDLCLLENVTGTKGIKIAKTSFPTQMISTLGYPKGKGPYESVGFLGDEVVSTVAHFGITSKADEKKCLKELKGQVDTYILSGEKVCFISYLSNRISMIVFGGQSGSPVVNNDNELVGIIFASKDSKNGGLGSIIPYFDVTTFLNEFEVSK